MTNFPLGLFGTETATISGMPSGFDLISELKNASQIMLATAFARSSGWNLLKDAIASCQGTVKLLTGLNFCQTEPQVLKHWKQMAELDNVEARYYNDPQRIFHPKSW